MGCASSKRIEATAAAVVYHPPPTSFAVFDINAIEEPWLKHLNNPQFPDKKTADDDLPPQILHMLDATTDIAPQSWDEVSKKLVQHLKPIVQPPPPPPSSTSPPPQTPSPKQHQPPRKVASFHTLEELDSKLSSPVKPKKTTTNTDINKSQPLPPPQHDDDDDDDKKGGVVVKIIKPVKENPFIVKDRMERQKEEKESNYERLRRNPLIEYPEKCPPGGNESVVIYTTSLGGVRKTFDDCNRARDLLENHRVVFDERDVALHGEFLKEVKELLLELADKNNNNNIVLPRVFVKGRYLGGLEELLELNETGRLGRILNATRVERGVGRLGCGGCGGVRFVPCFDCAGSCKLQLGPPGNGITQRVEDLCIQSLHTCYLLDFIPPKEFIFRLSHQSKCKIIGFDHRKSVLKHIPSANDFPENIMINVNPDRSSSTAVYDYFNGKHEDVRASYGVLPSLVDSKDKGRLETILKYIEDGDLRRWTLPDIKSFNIGLGEWRSNFSCISNPHMFKQLMELSAEGLIAQGNSCLLARQNAASKLLQKVFRVRLGRGFYGECLGVRADGNSNLSGEIGKLLSVKSAANGLRPIGAVIFMQRDNLKMCLRSTDCATDTSEIAKAYGGGGSPSSSSFMIRMDEYNQWISVYSSS